MSARLTASEIKPANFSYKQFTRHIKSGKYRHAEDGSLERHCNKCDEYWPADSEFFFSAGSKGDGLTNWCKACYVEWRFPESRGAVGHQFGVQKGECHAS